MDDLEQARSVSGQDNSRVRRWRWLSLLMAVYDFAAVCFSWFAVLWVRFDFQLSQMSGEVVVAQESATLAYVSGAGGGPITVRANPGTRKWERGCDPRVYAFDPAWQGESGESGYDIAWPICRSMSVILR